jgi:hypothetical protein
MRARRVVGGMPPLPCFQLVRPGGKNPRGVTYHEMIIKLVVHHDFPDAEIEQECRLLKEQVVCVSVRCVMVLLDADNRRVVVFVKSQQRSRITSLRRMVLLGVTNQFCALCDCTVSTEVSRVRGER